MAASLDISEDKSVDSSASDYIFDMADTPQTRRRKRRKRFTVANISFTSSMKSPPPSSPRSSTPKLEQSDPVQQRQDPPPPPHQKSRNIAQVQNLNPSNTFVCPEPANLIFCGLKPPCPCLNQLRPAQLRILPPNWPVYLPVGHPPCSQDCGSHYVHQDNLHPPNPNLCPCDPPRLGSALSCSATYQPQAYSEMLPLPPDFRPCGYYCSYEDCDCLRQYDGRDWAS